MAVVVAYLHAIQGQAGGFFQQWRGHEQCAAQALQLFGGHLAGVAGVAFAGLLGKLHGVVQRMNVAERPREQVLRGILPVPARHAREGAALLVRLLHLEQRQLGRRGLDVGSESYGRRVLGMSRASFCQADKEKK